MLILRPVAADDLDAAVALAEQLDSVNLPSDRDFLEQRIECSLRSFADAIDDWREGVYVFVLEDRSAGRCVGTSTILAKHGRPGAPYFWLAETSEERRSAELGKRFVHKKLQLHSTEDGPSEIGGLILDPAYRRHPEKCGKALSIVRFAYISMHPEHFEREVIAEMLSPFEAPGKNLLWDAFGARFTGLPYREADHLSVAHQAVHRRPLPARPGLRHALPRGGAGGDRQAQRDGEGGAAHPREDRLPLPEPGGPLRRRPLLRRRARGHHAGARAAPAGAAGQVYERDVAPPDGPLALLAEGEHGFRATVVVRSTTRARRWSRSSAARRWASPAATAST